MGLFVELCSVRLCISTRVAKKQGGFVKLGRTAPPGMTSPSSRNSGSGSSQHYLVLCCPFKYHNTILTHLIAKHHSTSSAPAAGSFVSFKMSFSYLDVK